MAEHSSLTEAPSKPFSQNTSMAAMSAASRSNERGRPRGLRAGFAWAAGAVFFIAIDILNRFARGGKPLAVGRRRRAEEAAVLARELAGALVAHAVARRGGVQRLADEELARVLQPQLLLELQRAHGRDRPEM